MIPWHDRSPEVAALLNPAFCGLVIFSAIDGYVAEAKRSMPFEYTFVILPLVLHPPTRANFPKQVGSPFNSWISAQPTLRIGYAERVRATLPVTRESIMYMMHRECLVVDGGSVTIGANRPKMSSKKVNGVDEIRKTVNASILLGRLLAGAGTSSTIYTILGISP